MRRARRPALAGLALATLALCGALAARADGMGGETPASAVQRCATIATAPERLACYDALAERLAAPIVAATPPKAAPPPRDAFGLTPPQRPATGEVQSISAHVVRFGRSADGRPTVQLDNDQLWELDSADPLLAAAELVTIRRGALGSFLMTTPEHRTHRVRRLR